MNYLIDIILYNRIALFELLIRNKIIVKNNRLIVKKKFLYDLFKRSNFTIKK